MSDKTNALVTGANKGIGLAIARQLGEQGFAVWLGCRDADSGYTATDLNGHTGTRTVEQAAKIAWNWRR